MEMEERGANTLQPLHSVLLLRYIFDTFSAACLFQQLSAICPLKGLPVSTSDLFSGRCVGRRKMKCVNTCSGTKQVSIFVCPIRREER